MTLLTAGFSGCKIIRLDNHVIRKISPSVGYNKRLTLQHDKQKWFNRWEFENIFSPEILRNGYENGLYYFDMQYIDGRLFNEEFFKLPVSELDMHLETLLNYFDVVMFGYRGEYSSDKLKNAIVDKLAGLRSKNTARTEMIDNLLDYVYLDVKFNSIPVTFCHGDLTLSNILFTNSNQLCILDFLDSYIDSFIMDIIKLKQDLYYGWSLYFLPVQEHYKIRLKQMFLYMWNLIEEEMKSITNLELFKILDLINFLRIEPYLTEEDQKEILQKVIQETELYEKFNSSSC